MYSPDKYEVVAEVNSVVCITIISLIFGRKLASIDGPVRYIRILLLAYYSVSWAFSLIACMLTSTNNGNFISCTLTNFNCFIVYSCAKIILYLYFVEKIHIISVPEKPRLQTPLYLINLGLLVPNVAVIILQIMFRVNIVADEFPYHCTVGLDIPASSVSLCYDLFLTALCITILAKFYFYPNTAQQTAYQSSSILIMSMRNSIAAIVLLFTSSAYYLILIGLNGHERGLLASSVVALSLTINCTVIHWVTGNPVETQINERALQKANGARPVKLEIKQHQEVVILTELNNRI